MSNYNLQNFQHNLPLMMRNQMHSVRMVQLVQDIMPGASFTGTP